MDRLPHFVITNLDWLPRFGIKRGSIATFRHNYGIGYHVLYANCLGLGSMREPMIYHSSIDIEPFEALYGRGCRSPIGWIKAGGVKPLGVDLVKDAQDKVRSVQAKLLRQKKYVDHKVRDMTFQSGENDLLKVSHMQGVMRLVRKPWRAFLPLWRGCYSGVRAALVGLM
ncbi:hypothetical protein MTR67_051724 [Solanum verrucosum]|uniref:Uncharacterized protein n=1 Tax=Solanum verrucosum TaxID=315347 RepID=A0AAF1A302_SOLVR|nr:hypothetical protein MTR67_051724 [Solanum verrucosum]